MNCQKERVNVTHPKFLGHLAAPSERRTLLDNTTATHIFTNDLTIHKTN